MGEPRSTHSTVRLSFKTIYLLSYSRYNVAPRTHGVVYRRDERREQEQEQQQQQQQQQDQEQGRDEQDPFQGDMDDTLLGDAGQHPGEAHAASSSSSPNNACSGYDTIAQSMRWGVVPHWSRFEDKARAHPDSLASIGILTRHVESQHHQRSIRSSP
jgi:hypothetical protein